MNLNKHYLIFQMVDGVLIAMDLNYVIIMIVKIVLINHLHRMRNQFIGVIKMN
jgi:hypothetical protein